MKSQCKHMLFALGSIIIMMYSFTSCDSDKTDALYTFQNKMIGEYLRDSSATYSEFVRLLDTTKVMGLLNSYGTYTCFAPSNAAMHAYYKSKGRSSLADFSLDSLVVIAKDHLINGTAYFYSGFQNGRLNKLSMSDRYFFVSFDSLGFAYINKTSKIIHKDIELYNGNVHEINKVLDPTRLGVVEAIAAETRYSIFYQALLATGLADSLLKEKDTSYNPDLYQSLITVTKSMGQWYYEEIPEARKYGYTVLMESDATMNANGITDLASLKEYAARIYNDIYPDDANITALNNRKNSLNRFVAYHLIEKQLSYSKFIDDYVMYNNSFEKSHMINQAGLNMYEYIETMCPNTLIEVTRKGGTQETNLLNRNPDTDESVKIVQGAGTSDNDATNGVYHEIDKMLVYSKKWDDIISSKRLRFDAASFFPELTNNNMRGQGNTSPNLKYLIPRGYISRITCSEQTVVQYLTPYEKYQDYQGDEIFLGASTGKLYDFSIITPPIPAGTYEVRFGYLTNGKRGVAQLYFDGTPCGVPLNLNTSATDASIGYVTPTGTGDDPYGYENDKMMRNRGYMKGPASYRVPTTGWSSGINARYSPQILRRIMGTFRFKDAGHHVLAIKGLSGGEFMFDYLEFVPTSAIETEDIY